MSHEPGSHLRRRQRVLPQQGLNKAGPRSLCRLPGSRLTTPSRRVQQVRLVVPFIQVRGYRSVSLSPSPSVMIAAASRGQNQSSLQTRRVAVNMEAALVVQ